MSAELIVVNGPQAGKRYAIDKDGLLIGRAPNSSIVVTEPDVGWRHCQIKRQGDRFLATDLRTSGGTFINGMRSAERWLDDRDQIGIGKTVLMFRTEAAAEAAPVPSTDTKHHLLTACSLVFSFRALAAAIENDQRDILCRQIVALVSDLTPVDEAVVLLGSNPAELAAHHRERNGHPSRYFDDAVERVCQEGAFEDAESGVTAAPLYLAGALKGILAVKSSHLAHQLDTLTAVASLASVAFEASREIELLKAKNTLLEEEIGAATGIVGNSPTVRRLLELIERVAPRDTTVLITGESGTGKELIARALHNKSPRNEGAFVAVNCAALTETLFESELFGHEKGAFTGAISLKRGRFELAHGGTIFLDEVGELAPALQSKLLRIIQQREFERVGGTQAYPLDIRIIAATNRDLAQDVEEGKFREDLYYRLKVVTLHSPPLRDRKEDVALLARYFLERFSARCKRQVQGLSPEVEQMLADYHWPGNVRELENAMERAVVLGVSDFILPEDLPETMLESVPQGAGTRYHNTLGQAKRESILDAYAQGKGDYKQAARILGLHPNYLLRLVRNLGLREEITALQTGSAGR